MQKRREETQKQRMLLEEEKQRVASSLVKGARLAAGGLRVTQRRRSRLSRSKA